jgi:hypothetical protein
VKTLAIIFWGGELVAALALLIGAAIAIESILVTGPILAVIGLMFCLLSSQLQSWPTLVFALSGPIVTAIVALMIVLFELGPREAQRPAIAVLAMYLIAMLPIAGFSLIKIYRWENAPASTAPPWQFSLKTLLIVMTGACLVAASAKLIADTMYVRELPIFGGYALVVFALCAVVVWRFIAKRKQALPKANAEDNLYSPRSPV